MSLRTSSRRYPTASLAAIFAIGKPVALDASAELRETRGFISMTTMRPLSGLIANWTLEPPDRGDQLGDGVLPGDRVIKDRGVQRPP